MRTINDLYDYQRRGAEHVVENKAAALWMGCWCGQNHNNADLHCRADGQV